MAGSRPLYSVILLVLAVSPVTGQGRGGAASPVNLTPAEVEAGSPELIRVAAPGASSVEGEWLGRKFAFFQRGPDWLALGGADVEAPVGESTLHITAEVDGRTVDLSRDVMIHAAHYRTGSLSVAPKFVEPPPEAIKRLRKRSS